MKKLLTTIVAAIMAFGMVAGVGCSGGGGGIDETKSQLYIGNQNAGLGYVWLEKIIDNFEKQYANYSFEDGKVGVEVILSNKLEEYSQVSLTSTMETNDIDLYYICDVAPDSWISSGLIADTTNAIKAVIYDEDGELAEISGKTAVQSLEDRMYGGVQDKFCINGRYYGLPEYADVGGIIYDADLFEEKGYYFYASEYDNNGNIVRLGDIGARSGDADIGIGPDGIPGNSDDGLPETYTQFVTLMDQMASVDSIIPLTWSVLGYQARIAYNYIYANYEGFNDFSLNNSFSGTDSEFGEINDSNAWQLRGQQGRKAALQLFYDLANTPKYHSPNVSKSTQTHKEAEHEYVYSVESTSGRIAMLFEGGYWENEARSTFDFMESIHSSYGYGQRNFKLLPCFKFTNIEQATYGIKAQTTRENVLCARGVSSYECISNYSPRKAIAEKFIQFSHGASQMAVFTEHTNCIRPFNYTLTSEMRSTFTPFAESIYQLMEDGAKFVLDVDSSPLKRANHGIFNNESCWTFRCKVGVTEYYNPYNVFSASSSNTVESVFEAIKNYGPFTPEQWPSA